ncbi:hypothetical protein AB4453_21935 [Vibrio atlanticus]|uniref:hypothetical protein n=1 Tax=Vibrio TaxID=662 RepID=UPI000C84AF77|nr:hypothetical protein [Vibrio tasmaniensis]PML44606.1 hypothetical protein BCT76_18950 [Vibrio tasmaniensis]
MNSLDIIYDFPIEFYNQDFLSDIAQIETFSDALPEEQQTQFVDFIDKSNQIKARLLELKPDSIDINIFKEITKHINNISSIDDLNLKLENEAKIYLFSNLIIVNSEKLEDTDELTVEIDKFKLVNIASSIGSRFIYSYTNIDHPNNSICYINPLLIDKIDASDFSETNCETVYHLLYSLVESEITLEQPILMHKNVDSISINDAQAALKLHLLTSGEYFHEKKTLERIPSQEFKKLIFIENKYHQFSDFFTILSEYNSRKEILNKYLSLYHAIENFMFRLPIVTLTEQNDGKMFSVRDFHLLYSSIESTEQPALTKFFKCIYANDYEGGKYLNSLHDGFKNDITPLILDKALKQLKILTGKGEYYSHGKITHGSSKGNLHSNFACIVYKIRNSIVHNKETEFHLSHAYLSPEIISLLEQVIIPKLENLVFDLLIKKNNLTWYSHDKITLYS